MRLSPIEKPHGLALRLAYRMSRKRLGKVITPLAVVYARAPRSLKLGYAINTFMESGVSLHPELRLLIQTHVAQLSDCGFCVDIARAHALHRAMDMDKVAALADYRNDARFTDKERAALAYVEEAARHRRVSDQTFAELERHFSEEEIVEITLINAVEHFYNMVNLPLGIESDGLCAITPHRRDAAEERRTHRRNGRMALRILYVLFGLGALANGMYMLAAPDAWFHDGPPGVTNTGPFNPHFVRDVGIAFAVIGAGMLWSVFNLRRCWPVHMVAMLFLVGHALLHVAEILGGALPAEHWRHDALGVFMPALVLGGVAIPPVWKRLNPESEEIAK